ncbi:Tail-specific protease precursor [Polystyrenella longa]|uniref:Tail-specific protease n=1 Tax=Polystyrenella longa TaxID=2528007 RepID=A0A518CMA4_9PLAN|nr:carboxy terminal-processing peptidase [Polystyrenella longa]QDU80314.1 Tail-specific protease precursor [Polystyrenella longa]
MKLPKKARSASALFTLVICFAGFVFLANSFAPAESVEESTTKLVCELLAEHHISHPVIGDEVSAKVFHEFIDGLDSQKQYFYKSDIDELKKQELKLDDYLKGGDVKFAFDAFNLYKERVKERVDVAMVLINENHDFTVDEFLITDGDELEWATSKAELNERWRKRIKFDILNLKLANEKNEKSNETEADEEKKKPVYDPVERLTKRYERLYSNLAQTQDFEVFEMYIGALTHSLDPHTSYMSPQTLEDFQIQMSLKLTGIGASLRSEDGLTVIHRIIPGGAADKDGRLEAGDVIVRVGQEGQAEDQFEDIREMKLSRVVRFIRGPADTEVQLEVQKGKTDDIVHYTLVRKEVELKEDAVQGEIIDLETRVENGKGRVGVIKIPSFYHDFSRNDNNDVNVRSTARDVLQVLIDFQEETQKSGKELDGIIIDLRDNGGGALSEAIDVSGLFIEDGPVVQVKSKEGRVSVQSDDNNAVAYRGPLVVVCNRLSASASEIFAGVIKDYKRGIIVGDETTHGKGTVQHVMPVQKSTFGFPVGKPNGALKLTINQFYRVNGESTQNRGVESDVTLPSILDHGELGEKYLDNALAFDEIEVAEHDNFGLVLPDIVTMLQKRSAQRISQNDGFNKDLRQIARYEERKNRKKVTLNEAALRKDRQEDLEEESLEEKIVKAAQDDENGPLFPDEHYNNEVLNISTDYINVLRSKAKQTVSK